MNITISFKNLEHTPSLDDRIKEKSQKINKYFKGRTDLAWTCFVKDNKHYAEVKVNGPTFSYHAKAHSDTLYKSLDLVVSKIEKQLQRKKQKMTNKIHRKVVSIDQYKYETPIPDQEQYFDYEYHDNKKAA